MLEFGDDSGDGLAGGLDLSGGIEAAKRKPQAAADAVIVEAHGFEHMGGMDGSAGAGRAGGTTNGFFVEQHEHRLTINLREGQVAGVGEAMRPVAINFGAGDGGQQGVFEAIAESGDRAGFFGEMGSCESGGLSKAHDGGHILSASAAAVFLAAPQPGGEAHPFVDMEGRDALGAMKFVARQRKELGPEFVHVERKFPHTLDAVDMKGDFFGIGEAGNFLNGKEGARLVIGPQKRDQSGVGTEGLGETFGIKLSGGIDRQGSDLVTPARQVFTELDGSTVLDCGGDDVGLVRIERGGGEDGGVDRFRAAAGKDNFRWCGGDQAGHLLAGVVDGGSCAPTQGIDARWVAVFVAQPGSHGLKDSGIDLGGGVVV